MKLVSIVLGFIGIGGTYIGIVRLLVEYRRFFLASSDAFLFGGTNIANFLTFLPPLALSLPIGLIIGNFLLWCIPPVRAASEREAAGGRGDDYRETQLEFAKYAGVIMAFTVPLCVVGVNSFWALTPDHIEYRPVLSATTQHYEWSSVEGIETGCRMSAGKGRHRQYHFVLKLKDETRIDLVGDWARDFLIAYPQIQSALKGNSYRFSGWKLGDSCGTSFPERWLEILSERPTE
jgi:hypothetical protein